MGTLKSTRGSQVPIYRIKNRCQIKVGKTRVTDERRKAEWVLGQYKSVIVLILVGLSRHSYCYLM